MDHRPGTFYVRQSHVSDVESYDTFVAETNGGFGWLSEKFLLLMWSLPEAEVLNREYQVSETLPQLRLIGSDCCGEAIGLTLHGTVMSVPFVGMGTEHWEERAPDLRTLFQNVTFLPAKERKEPDEIIEIKPVLFGGSPTDSLNKASVDRQTHIEYVRYWNGLYRSLGS